MEDKMIICPYCFKEFRHDQVLFRAETCFFEEDILDADDLYDIIDENERDAARVENDLKKKFLVGVSREYEEYWSKYGGTTEKTRRKSFSQNVENYQKPLIDPHDSTQVKFDNEDKSGVKLDADGYLTTVYDIFSNQTNNRVCPHCHNPLPMNYGKFPVKFISIIGITNAGKTVYLSSLFDNIYKYMGKIGMTPLPSESVDFFIESNKIKKGAVLPQGTSAQQMCQPLCFNLQYFDSHTYQNTKNTFVIYDIAGENCTDKNAIKNFGGFIEHSDGIIILEDPNQFEIIAENDQDMVGSVLRTINETFIGTDYCDIPIAMCISKSDILINNGFFDRKLCQKLTEDVNSAENQDGFNAKDYNKISNMLDQFYFDRDRPTRLELKNAFDNFNYFAVSALNCRLEPSSEIDGTGKTLYVPAEKPHPLRIEEPLYWLFYQFGFIHSDEEIVRHAVISDIDNLNKKIKAAKEEKAEIQKSLLPPWVKKKKTKDIDERIERLMALIKEKYDSRTQRPVIQNDDGDYNQYDDRSVYKDY